MSEAEIIELSKNIVDLLRTHTNEILKLKERIVELEDRISELEPSEDEDFDGDDGSRDAYD